MPHYNNIYMDFNEPYFKFQNNTRYPPKKPNPPNDNPINKNKTKIHFKNHTWKKKTHWRNQNINKFAHNFNILNKIYSKQKQTEKTNTI